MKRRYFLQLLVILLTGFWSYGQIGNESPPNTDYNNIKMPETPTAAAFGKIEELGVNSATGIPNITIPLYTFELDGASVPISISYNASGIKVSEVATSVGMNWSLNAGGQISRTVRAKADEHNGWFDSQYSFLDDEWYEDYDPNDPDPWQREMIGVPDLHRPGKAKLNDHMPDQFNYSFGSHSGSFIYTPNQYIIKEKTDGVRIYEWDNPEDPFKAEDLDGNKYEFWDDHTEIGKNKLYFSSETDVNLDYYDWEGDDGFFPVTAWKLSKITTKNNKTILFDYDDVSFSYTENAADSNITLGGACSNAQPVPLVKSVSYTKVIHTYNTRLIKSISSPDGNVDIEFTYEEENPSSGVWRHKLTEITITDSTYPTAPKIKRFRFVYDRYNGDPRLRLEELYEVGYDENQQPIEKPSYFFTYKPGSLPAKSSKKRDFFGYFNNSQDPTLGSTLVPCIDNIIYPYNGYFYSRCRENMSVNPSTVDVGILSEIQYPTGGRTVLEFEPNQEPDKYMGGLRVRSITQMDGTVSSNKKIYDYEDLRGFDMEHYRAFTMQDGASGSIFNSSFSATSGSYSGYKYGFFYGKVSIISIDDVSGTSFKEEHYYEEDENNLQKFDYVLKAKRYYRENGSTPIKTEEYDNAIVGIPTNFEWNILGETICYTNQSNYDKTGYTTIPTPVFLNGDYAYLPTKITTKDFFGSNNTDFVATIKEIAYDEQTLLRTQEITDTGDEIITTDFQYPWSDGIDIQDLPKALPISKIVYSNKHGNDPISGQYFEYDTNGNIKRTYKYNKGEVGNTSSPVYVPNNYEEMTTFLFSSGRPVQVRNKSGEATSYIWGYNNEHPVVKIEGIAYSALLSGGHVTAFQGATYPFNQTNFTNASTSIKNAYPTAMVTTYTYKPLAGVETITDPKGDKITYYYDAFGRLEQVKDKDGKILSENEYHYRPQ